MASFNTSLAKVQVAVEQSWRDPILNTSYIAKTAALTAQLQRQTATLSPIRGTGKNAKSLTQTIYWPLSCSITTASCSDECAVATAEATDNSQDVTLSCLRQVSFKETRNRFRTSPLSQEQVVALQMLANMKALDEYLTQQYIAFLEANKGDHEYTLSIGSDVSGDWQIPAADWTVEIIPELVASAEMSRLTNPYMLDGANFYTQMFRAKAFNANSDGKGEMNMFSEFPYVSDLVNMSTAAPGKTYMVNPSSVAFISGNFYDTTPMEHAGAHRMFKMPSRNLPGVFYDVHEVEACTSGDLVNSYQIRVNGAFVLNPLGCEEGRTGILSFEKV